MTMKPKGLTPVQIERRMSDDNAFLYVRLLPSDPPPHVQAELGPGEMAVEAQVGLRQDLTVEAQQRYINVARAILNEMEAALGGGTAPGKPGAKA